MADSTDDLEPLFDYSRVQPFHEVCLDDDSPPVSAKRAKVSDPKEKKNGQVAIFIDCEDDEEDWLLPPPSMDSIDTHELGEDSTIKELRLKKQELISFTQSAEDVLEAGGDSANRELGGSLQSSLDKVAGEASRPSERVKIVISIQDKDGLKQFRIYMDDKFERLFKLYADKVKLDLGRLVFCFDGDKIAPAATPLGLGMEDDDIVEVHVKPS